MAASRTNQRPGNRCTPGASAAGSGGAERRLDFIYSRIRQWIRPAFRMPLQAKPTVPQTAPLY
jgi:hypothetical protein